MKKSPYDETINTEVFSLINNNSTCLDVGCWGGNLGAKLIREKECIVDGIDNNLVKLKEAKRRGYRETYLVDLNTEYPNIIRLKHKYDYIIFADILEHLIEPNEVLGLLKLKLNEKGLIIISLPNIAFILQRFLLLFGKFNYSENGGIMDKTHLRFFTMGSLHKFVEEADFRIEKIYGYSLVKNKFFFLRFLAKLFPKLFAIQLMAIARKK